MKHTGKHGRLWWASGLLVSVSVLVAALASRALQRVPERSSVDSSPKGVETPEPPAREAPSRPSHIVTTNAVAGVAALGSALDRLEERHMLSLTDEDWTRLLRAARSPKTARLRDRVRASTGPLISGIKTDAKELCAGETLLVQAEMLDPDARVWVNGSEANPAMVQLHQPGRRFVYVRAEAQTGSGARDVDVERIAVDVRDCARPASLMLSATSSQVHAPTAIVRVTFPPGSTDPSSRSLSGQSFLYDFGDGVVEQSTLPIIQHTYDAGSSRLGQSIHYIKVTATDPRGQEVSGRTSYSYRRSKDTPALPPDAPDWMKPQGDPIVEARRSRELSERMRGLPEAYRTGRAKPPEGPLGEPQAWAHGIVPDMSDDGVKPR